MARNLRFARTVGVALLVFGGAAVGAVAALALGRAGLPPVASAQGQQVLGVWRLLLVLAGSLCGVVVVLLGLALLHGTRRSAPSSPNQVAGNVRLEIAYTAIPLLLVGGIFAAALRTESRLDQDGSTADLEVGITGFRWGWRFAYSTGYTVVGYAGQNPELVLPENRVTRLLLVTTDVQHSFFVPEFIMKRDLVAGVRNELQIKPIRTGVFRGHCAEYCGIDHAGMNFAVRVLPAAEFDEWLAQQPRETVVVGGGS